MCIMPMTALVMIVSGATVILVALVIMFYCVVRLRNNLQRALEEDRAYRKRKRDFGYDGLFTEFCSLTPRQTLVSSSQCQSGDHVGPYARRYSSLGRTFSCDQ
ncbi:uncharacterized protein LOC144142118 [Haemaphysalis longicornis]